MNIQGLPHGRRSEIEAWIPTALALAQQVLQKSLGVADSSAASSFPFTIANCTSAIR